MKNIDLVLLFVMLVFLSCKNEQSDEAISEEESDRIAAYEKLGIDTQNSKEFSGLNAGDQAPDFSGIDQYGNEHNLSSLTGDSSLVMIFYRGQWCSICNRYLSKLSEDLDSIVSMGARVIAVAPELQENVAITVQNTGLEIPVISDLDRSIMDAYKVSFRVNAAYQQKIRDKLNTDIATNNGDEEAWLPIPATYIIGADKQIKYVHFDPNYRSRASIQNIIDNL